jgi:hypothetical protein
MINFIRIRVIASAIFCVLAQGALAQPFPALDGAWL